MFDKKVSMAVVKRMPKYYKHVLHLLESGVTRISSSKLAENMGLTASQVRQDFNCFGGFGQQGYGYNVLILKDEIAAILNIDQRKKAIVIGIGNFGKALLNNFNFAKCGVEVIAGFDPLSSGDAEIINDVPIFHIDNLESFMLDNSVDIAVLTLPKKNAKDMTQRLIDNSIRGIWNFTNMDLHLEFEKVPIEDVSFSESLMTLSYRISDK